MKKCHGCGNLIQDNIDRCPSCGFPVNHDNVGMVRRKRLPSTTTKILAALCGVIAVITMLSSLSDFKRAASIGSEKEEINSEPLNASQGIGYVEGREIAIQIQDELTTGLYTGELKDSQPHGKGDFEGVTKEGIKWTYTGDWKDGMM